MPALGVRSLVVGLRRAPASYGTSSGWPAVSGSVRGSRDRHRGSEASQTSDAPDAPSVAPETAPDKQPHAAPRSKDAPRTDARPPARPSRQAQSPPRQADNPLREGLRLERVPDPSVLVLFGATGDLAHRKVIPALYQLWRTNLLRTIRRPCRGSSGLRRREPPGRIPRVRSRVLARPAPRRRRLARLLGADPLPEARLREPGGLTTRWSPSATPSTRSRTRKGNHLYYLATQPSAFAEIVGQLGRVGLDHERHEGGWRRIVIEKPFGHDLNSAIRLNREVGKVFPGVAGLPDRSLPRQGDGPEPPRLPVRDGSSSRSGTRRHIDHVQITVARRSGSRTGRRGGSGPSPCRGSDRSGRPATPGRPCDLAVQADRGS